jgi:alpha-beta hydrolase superfamily lysophospholipase
MATRFQPRYRTILHMITAFVLLALALLLGLAAAIAWGGPQPIAALASINEPFARVDYAALPAPRHYTARDGTRLAWLHYPPATQPPTGRRIVLVHVSSARARSMHVLAMALAGAGFEVAALDLRGHGDSGSRGHAAYLGQLEDDLEDFLRAAPYLGRSTLLGFSSGGGFVLRFAASERQALFDRYVLLSPFLHHTAPTNRPANGGWVSVGLPRYIALTVLNRFGITAWNHLPVMRFGLNDAAQALLTPSYDYTLATNFRPNDDYQADIRRLPAGVRLLAGTDDELFEATRFDAVFADAGHPAAVALIPGVNHIGLTLAPAAVQAVVRACAE